MFLDRSYVAGIHSNQSRLATLEAYVMLLGVDQLYSQIDLDEDGRIGDLRFAVDQMHLLRAEPAQRQSAEQMLVDQAAEDNRNCLSIRLAHLKQVLPDRPAGSTADTVDELPLALGYVGSACRTERKLRKYVTAVSEVATSENVLLLALPVTGRYSQRMFGVLALAKELGHALGSLRDSDNDSGRGCGFGYLMNSRLSPKTPKMSSCSKREVVRALQQIDTRCLADRTAKCGNLAVEPDEQCDCGGEALCSRLQRCCQPSVCKLRVNCTEESRPAGTEALPPKYQLGGSSTSAHRLMTARPDATVSTENKSTTNQIFAKSINRNVANAERWLLSGSVGLLVSAGICLFHLQTQLWK